MIADFIANTFTGMPEWMPNLTVQYYFS